MTYLVSIRYAQHETDVYVVARNEEEAVSKVRFSLDPIVRRWASVFVG